MSFMCRAKSLARAEQLRDKAIELNAPHGGGYVAIPPTGLPMVFVRLQTQELFNQWYEWARYGTR